MSGLNLVCLLGRLTRDPEKRVTPGGMVVCDLALALNRKVKSANGDQRDEVLFVDVTTFGKLANLCAAHLRKGQQALVEGRLKMDQWEKDGQKRSKLVVIANNVVFVSGGKEQERSAAPEPADPPARDTSATERRGPSLDADINGDAYIPF